MSPGPHAPPGVSVVVPAYNEERSIARTLESLLCQTRPADEIIVADGGSTDRTREVAARFSGRGPPVRIVDNPRRRVGAARNVGVASARFRWVALIDAGNWADAAWLERILEPLSADGEPVVSFGRILPAPESRFEACVAHVLFDYLFVSPDGAAAERQRRAEGKEMISSSCMAYPRELLERVGGYPEWLDTSEDKLFVRRARELGIPIVRSPRAIVHHHMRKDAAGLVRMYFRYGRGNGLSGQISRNTLRLGARYAAAAAAASVAVVGPGGAVRLSLLALLAAGASLYVLRQGYRPVLRSGGSLSAGTSLLVPVVLLARDAGSLAGHSLGFVQRLGDRHASRRLRRYLMNGNKHPTVRAYRPDDLPAIMALYERVWGRSFRGFMERAWAWKFDRCPFPTGEDGRHVVEQDGRIVGYLGYQPMAFKIGSQRRVAAWLADFMVAPDSRGRGAGLALAREAIRNGNPNLFGQVGKQYFGLWSKLYGRDARATRGLWVRRDLRDHRAAIEIVRNALRGVAPRTPSRGGDRVRVEPASGPDVVATALDRLLATHEVIAYRTVDYLRWRFFECPYAAHRMLVARRGPDVAGYVVLREDRSEVTVVADILAARDDVPAYCALLGAAVDAARRERKRAVEAIEPSEPGGLRVALAEMRFLPPLRHRRECYFVGKTEPELRSVVHAEENWFVTAGDSDMDMRESP